MAKPKRKTLKKVKTAASKRDQRVRKPKPAPHAQVGAAGGFQNPFRAQGAFWASVEALKALGTGTMHPFNDITSAVKKSMGTDCWKAFADKPQRNEATAKDAKGRAIQNLATLSRQDYGKPLRDIGYVVRFDGRAKQAGLFRLSSK